MVRLNGLLLVVFALSGLLLVSSCGGGDEPAGVAIPEGFDPDAVDETNKADSAFSPSDMGELTICGPMVEGEITPSSGFHEYTIEGRKGWKVEIEFGGDYLPYARMKSPSGKKRSYYFTPDQIVAKLEGFDINSGMIRWLLPEDGTYKILLTSLANMALVGGAVGHLTTGPYKLTIQAEIECELGCADYMECGGEPSMCYPKDGSYCRTSGGMCYNNPHNKCEWE